MLGKIEISWVARERGARAQGFLSFQKHFNNIFRKLADKYKQGVGGT